MTRDACPVSLPSPWHSPGLLRFWLGAVLHLPPPAGEGDRERGRGEEGTRGSRDRVGLPGGARAQRHGTGDRGNRAALLSQDGGSASGDTFVPSCLFYVPPRGMAAVPGASARWPAGCPFPAPFLVTVHQEQPESTLTPSRSSGTPHQGFALSGTNDRDGTKGMGRAGISLPRRHSSITEAPSLWRKGH